MRTVKSLIITVLLFPGSVLMAQDIDTKRMERDLEIAENILGALLRDGHNRGLWMAESVKGTYIDDYGVILMLPQNFSRHAPTFSFNSNDKDVVIFGSDGENVVTVNVPKVEIKKVSLDSLENLRHEKLVKSVKIFLADYGNLISQLKPEHKIIVTNREGNFHWMRNNQIANNFSAEVKMSDINSYKAGKISREELMERIEIANEVSSEEKSTDMELLATIFDRLYSSDLSDTYYISTNTYLSSSHAAYDRVKGFGVIYRMQVYSSSGEGENHTIITTGQSNLTRQERDDIVKKMYPEFVKELKDNILEYGKTLNSLESDEVLMFQVKLTKCEGCNIPGEIELSVKQQVLQEYSSGKMNKAEALKKISISEKEIQ